jgi:hypothetical protein
VSDACSALLDPDRSLDRVIAWLGGPVEVRGDSLVAGRDAIPGVLNVSVDVTGGVATALSAWSTKGEGPTLVEAEAALGPVRELPRHAGGPYFVAFTGPVSPAGSCVVSATTYDPPTAGGTERRIVEVLVRRDAQPSHGAPGGDAGES